jgi:hypothetical protein
LYIIPRNKKTTPDDPAEKKLKMKKFETLEDAKKFAETFPNAKITAIYRRTMGVKDSTQKIYVVYDAKKYPPINNAVVEGWDQAGLLD